MQDTRRDSEADEASEFLLLQAVQCQRRSKIQNLNKRKTSASAEQFLGDRSALILVEAMFLHVATLVIIRRDHVCSDRSPKHGQLFNYFFFELSCGTSTSAVASCVLPHASVAPYVIV